MPYIGKSPISGGFHKLDALAASATDIYALTLGGAAYYPETANQLLVSLNGVIQACQDSFTVSGSNLIFDSALTTSDSIDFVVALGDVLGVGSVSDGAITASKLAAGLGFAAGMIMSTAGTSAPTGWLLTYGQAVSRTTYADLFTAIGTTYGVGDGSSTFNVPDLRGRVIAGQDDMGGTSANRLTNQSGGLDGDTLGASGGAETHQLTEDEMPAHTHGISDGSDSDSGTANRPRAIAGTDRTSTSTGGDDPHNNVQPTLILNYIIKT
jgi:microcystin-dependent protein